MKHIIWIFVAIATLSAIPVAAQEKAPEGELHIWFDAFVGADTPILYPQYGWRVETKTGTFSGYGFLEQAPQEPLFTNHLVVWTPGKQKFFSIQTETGGLPETGKGFFQVGPRLNLPVKKMAYVFVTYLPELQGIRTNNFLVAAGTKAIPLGEDATLSIEMFRRFFDGPDYSEYWFLVNPKIFKHLSIGAHVLHDGNRALVNVGGRISFF